MRIGYDAKRAFNNRAGLGVHSRTLIDNMLRYHPEDDYHLYTPSIALTDIYDSYQHIDNISIHQAMGMSKSYWRSWSITDDLTNHNIDIYHGVSHEIPRNIQKVGCASVVTIHDVIFKKFPRYFPLTDRIVYDQKWKHAIATADKVIAVSESTKNDILEYYPIPNDKIEVVYSSCHPRFYQSDTEDSNSGAALPSEYILSVGSIEPRKNYETLLRALAQIPAKSRPHLVIVGRGKTKYVSKINDLIMRLGFTHQVTILSDVTDDNIRAIYQGAAAFIYPSYYEGHGLPITEALYCGVPVVASSTSSMPEAGGPDCIYIDPLDAEELAHAIRLVLTDTPLRNKMVVNGLAYAQEKFDPKRVTDQMYAVYKSLL